jgi:hypothetical protein
MESDSSAKVEIPANFEDAPVEDLVELIGELCYPRTFFLSIQSLLTMFKIL